MENTMKKKKNLRRVLAWAGIVLLAGMYAADLILALIRSPAATMLLRINLFMTLVLPLLLWVILVLIGKTDWQNDQVNGRDQHEGK